MKKLTTKQIFKINQERKSPGTFQNTKIWLHNIRSMHNVGSAFRTADAFGISEIILSGYSPVPPRAEISKTALGADQFIKWSFTNNIQHTCSELKKEEYQLLGLEQTTNSRLLTEYMPNPDKNTCYIFGNEVTGVEEELLLLCDEVIEIPQFGKKHSFNVSVSIGIVLYDRLIKA
ncbi:MAG: TrmH family RNA methyltransferase [Balneolales bacterium]